MSGLAPGTRNRRPGPAAGVSRQALAAFVYRLDHDGRHAPACQEAPFSDVPTTNHFCGAIAWLAEFGIDLGDSDEFHPALAATRSHTAVVLFYYDGYRTANTPR